MTPYVLISGDFVTTGGMDRANHGLASYLARRGYPVHLVGHRAADDLLALQTVSFHPVRKPAGSYFLGGYWLDRRGRECAASCTAAHGRVVVNGGNCCWGDVNWVHYVHAAYRPATTSTRRRWTCGLRHRLFVRQERHALGRARLVLANSVRTCRDVIERVGVRPERVRTVYYGVDSAAFYPIELDEQRRLREELGWKPDRPVVAFIGALGDRRKGFDTLFEAWQRLCRRPSWDGDLAVVGTGADMGAWQRRVDEEGLTERVRFLGFRTDVPRILRAADALAAPTRYEAYGLGVHEALCCGLPAFVSRDAGVAERYPADLAGLLLDDPDDALDLEAKLLDWRERIAEVRARTRSLADRLRQFTWDDMAKRIECLVEQAG